MDGSDNIWAGYYSQQSAKKYSPSGSLLTTVSLGFNVCKIDVDRTNGDLYVVHYSGGQITKYTAASGYTTTLNFPSTNNNAGLAVNGAENRLYVAGNTSTIKVYDTETARRSGIAECRRKQLGA